MCEALLFKMGIGPLVYPCETRRLGLFPLHTSPSNILCRLALYCYTNIMHRAPESLPDINFALRKEVLIYTTRGISESIDQVGSY